MVLNKVIDKATLMQALGLLLLFACNPMDRQLSVSPLIGGGPDAARTFLQAWRAGRMIVLIRHTERCDRANNACLDGNTGITSIGREMARQIGGFFSELPEVERKIYSSPVKRTQQTAMFMFGPSHARADWLGSTCKVDMNNQVVSIKQPGQNLLLVTHSNCMMVFDEAHGWGTDLHDFDSYGIVLFFTLDSELKPIGHLLPSDWPVLLANIRLWE